MGLFGVAYLKTHKGHNLDRIYCSQPIYDNTKVVTSTISTAHKAVLAFNGHSVLCNNKTKKTVSFRKQGPSCNASLLRELQFLDWGFILDCCNVQEAADKFYDTCENLMDRHYPIKCVTLSNRDPEFVTPVIKSMLRKKNCLMRRNKPEEANALAEAIRNEISRNNSNNFRTISLKKDCKLLWKKVNEVLGRTHNVQSLNSNVTAKDLNDFYAQHSTDSSYVRSSPKDTCFDNRLLYFSEMNVFHMLDNLKPTAAGPDGLVSWFLKISAPGIAKPLSHLFNLSIKNGIVPTQWKMAQISPVPKISNPINCADFRPISLTSIPSRLFEKTIAKQFIYPIYSNPDYSSIFGDQFAFRPDGSTAAALIAILEHISKLLLTHNYVRVISFDFSKAFDTVKHSCILTKLSNLPIDDCVYNWFCDRFVGHQHCTKFKDTVSPFKTINASVFQGSATGPSMFVVTSSDLKPVNQQNYLDKYADDTYLIVGSSNEITIDDEIAHMEDWAKENNLKLNRNKSKEIVFRNHKDLAHSPNNVIDIPRVDEIKILGVTVSNTFSFTTHINNICTSAVQSMFAIKTLKSQGMSPRDLATMVNSFVISKLTYAAPAWWGFTTAAHKMQLQSVVNKCAKWGLCSKINVPNICDLINSQEKTFFNKILSNSFHPLHPFLPPPKQSAYNLKLRVHGRTLPKKDNKKYNSNFMLRMLYNNSY